MSWLVRGESLCIISIRRSQALEICLGGAVARPRSKPDFAEPGDAYHAESGAGDMPKASVSLAAARSGVPSGKSKSTANPATAACCDPSDFSKASRWAE